MRNTRTCFVILIYLILTGCGNVASQNKNAVVKLGAEVLLDDHLHELKGKRVGLLMNPASRVDGTHMLDTLMSLGVDVRALFAAEHGFRGQAGAGEKIRDGVDSASGLPVFSLYQDTRKPAPEMLEEIDLILFDLPDVGARFFTYSTTLGLVIEAVSEADKEIWILDRPDPAGGEFVSGYILQDEFRSFVGSYPLPSAYGMTIGEVAMMAIGEQWLDLEREPKVRVIRSEGWSRAMTWQDTGIPWFSPSPNLPTDIHAYIYLGTVLFEGTNISEGRGTGDPFLMIGSPQLDFDEQELSGLEQKYGLELSKGTFTPVSMPGKATNPKYKGEECTSVMIDPGSVKPGSFDPVAFGYDLLLFVQDHTADFEVLPFINNLSGIGLKTILEDDRALPGWNEEVKAFKERRKPYLLY